MERNREAKKERMAAVNGIGLSRRRHRITALRDSPEEEGQMELQETVRSREREQLHKVDNVRDRDQELVSQPKKRRMEKCLERRKHRDVESGDAEDSPVPSGEETYEEDDEEPSSSMLSNALRRTVTSTRNFRSISGLRIADEMIGAAVPRRTRSASVKRLNKQWNSSRWGFGEWQSRRRLSPSPLAGSVNIFSPSSSSVSLRRKTKPQGSKGLISKVSRKPLISAEDDIDIEVVEALFDLMKQSQLQSQSSKKDETISANIYVENLDSIGNKDFHTKPLRSPPVSAQIGSEASDLPLDINFTSTASLDVDLSTESEFGKMLSGALVGTGKISLAKGKHSSELAQESGGGVQVAVAKEEESRSCAKSNVDGSTDSSESKANLASEVVKPKREANLEIDLMAPPPLPSSPDRDRPNIMVPDLKLDLEKPEHENVSSCSYKNSQQRDPKEQNHCIVSNSEGQSFGQSNSLPSPDVTTNWPGGFPQPGYRTPHKTLLPIDKSSRIIALQLPPFTLSQPRSKKCVTHQYIACGIRHHQQLTKNCMQPAVTGATLLETKHRSGNPKTSTSNSFLGCPLQGDLPGRHALATPESPSVLSMKGKSSDAPNAVDLTKGKQLVPQHASDQARGGNLSQPSLIFPLDQHQVANFPAQLPGLHKYAIVIGEASLSNRSAGGPALGSFPLLAGATAVSFNFSNLPTSDAPPLMGILQSNAPSYSISTNSGMPLPIKGAQAPVLPFLNGSYYPSMFCVPQNQQKQSACQPQSNHLYRVLQAFPTSGTSSSLTSSLKQSKSQQQIVAQISNHNSFSSEGLQLHQSQNQQILGSHSSSKSVDSPGSHVQKADSGKNYGSLFQTMNFSLVPPRDRNQQQPGTEHSVAVIPPQAIGFSFDSTASTKLAMKLSSSDTRSCSCPDAI